MESETRQRADGRSPHARMGQKPGVRRSGPRARVVRKTVKRAFVVRTSNAYQETQTEWYTGLSDNRRIWTEQPEGGPIVGKACQLSDPPAPYCWHQRDLLSAQEYEE